MSEQILKATRDGFGEGLVEAGKFCMAEFVDSVKLTSRFCLIL